VRAEETRKTRGGIRRRSQYFGLKLVVIKWRWRGGEMRCRQTR
jgi:hypothetical protein